MRVRNLFPVLLILPMALLISFSPAQGAPLFDTWSGPFSFKASTLVVGGGKFVKSSGNPTGTLEIYMDPPNGPPMKNGEGYYMRLIDAGDVPQVGITNLAVLRTEVPNSKSDKIVGVGVGEKIDTKGPVYVDIKGAIAKDELGNITSISMTMKLAGSNNSLPDTMDIFSGSMKVTMTKALP